MKIFLDDIRKPFWIYDNPEEWTLVQNFEELTNAILENYPNISHLSFDNDLGTDDKGINLLDGYFCLNWLIDNDLYIENILVHSDNVVASEQIYNKASNWMNFSKNNGFYKYDFQVLKRPAMKHLTDTYKKTNSK